MGEDIPPFLLRGDETWGRKKLNKNYHGLDESICSFLVRLSKISSFKSNFFKEVMVNFRNGELI